MLKEEKMQDKGKGAIFRLPIALVLGLVISLISLKGRHIFPITESSPEWLGAFITHSFMWLLSVLIIILLTKGKMAEYGFTKGSFRLTGKIFLWIIPTAILSIVGFFALRSGADVKPGLGFAPLQTIIFVWIYASVAEEIFTRGLLQSFLSPLTRYGINLSGKLRLSLPVLFSGLYFGLMHIVAIDKMGPPVILLATLLGIVAGYYREKTESLIPAIIIHALFNIGGSLPMWILSWLL
jgi:membrane protease YdiL (CAAX protease family)